MVILLIKIIRVKKMNLVKNEIANVDTYKEVINYCRNVEAMHFLMGWTNLMC